MYWNIYKSSNILNHYMLSVPNSLDWFLHRVYYFDIERNIFWLTVNNYNWLFHYIRLKSCIQPVSVLDTRLNVAMTRRLIACEAALTSTVRGKGAGFVSTVSITRRATTVIGVRRDTIDPQASPWSLLTLVSVSTSESLQVTLVTWHVVIHASRRTSSVEISVDLILNDLWFVC